MRRHGGTALLSLASLVVACTPRLAARKPLDQQPIGAGALGGPSATLPTISAAPSYFGPATPTASTSSDPAIGESPRAESHEENGDRIAMRCMAEYAARHDAWVLSGIRSEDRR